MASPPSKKEGTSQEGGLPKIVIFMMVWVAVMFGRDMLLGSQKKESVTRTEKPPPGVDENALPQEKKFAVERDDDRPPRAVDDEESEFIEMYGGRNQGIKNMNEQNVIQQKQSEEKLEESLAQPKAPGSGMHAVLVKLCTS
mmetsp:Transcript_4322/g.6117  ORF Transcript_4322/g.6117 Transcript_4322/m.6117 type:complete len:141 (-) Transcript_4322:982-1404(-)